MTEVGAPIAGAGPQSAEAARRTAGEGGASAAPLREAVLAGALFGPAGAAAAERLAAFLAGEVPPLAAWFGPPEAARLAGDAEALRLALDRDVAALDAMLADQVDAILHHPRLLRLEASWRGLAWLVAQAANLPRVKIKVIALSWAELVRDLERAIEFDQSRIFEKVYEGEFGMPGGEPFGLLIGDYAVRHRRSPDHPTDDVAALAAMAGVAAAAFAPFVVNADPALFGLEHFGELSGVRDLAAVFRTEEYARWRGLQEREDARFLGVVLPRVLARPAYTADGTRRDGFVYAEDATHHAWRPWVGAVYAFAGVVARAVATFGWPADVKGTDRDRVGGGLVVDLPVERFPADRAGVGPRFAVEVALTDRQEHDLAELGFIPLTWLRHTLEAAFGACRSLQAPRAHAGERAAAAVANARLSAQLSSMLCVSRFAHYVKMLGREKVGAYATAAECEAMLRNWLSGYVNANVRAGTETMARYPLAAAEVQVSELPGRPGHYGCTIHLKPQFQLDDVAATFRLVTEVPARSAA